MNVDDITPERVREVLRHLARDRTAGRTALSDLTVVRRALEEAGFQPTPTACQYEVGRLIADLVEQDLAALRGQAAPLVASLSPAAAVRADFAHGLRELEAWSAIYHLYLRPDLELGLKGLTGLLDDRHRRTVQRRLRRGAVALAARLQALEREARVSARREALADRVPEAVPTRLVGVDGLLRRAGERLRDPGGPAILALRGPGGIGKTALAKALAREALGGADFEDVAWLSAGAVAGAPSPSAVPPALLAGLARQLDGPAADASPAAVRAHLRRRHTLVVVDGLDDPTSAGAVVRALGMLVGVSRAVVTGRLGWSAWGDVQVLDVPALQPAAALALLRLEAAVRGLPGVAEAPDEVLAPVVAASRGHPLAIRLAAGQLRADDALGVARAFAAGEGVAAALCRDLWGSGWNRAAPAAQAVVRVASATGPRAIPRARLAAAAGLAPDAFTGALAEAVDLGLLEPTGDARAQSFRVPVFLRRYLRQVA